MLVKICGIMDQEAAQIASQLGTDYLGFVFAKSSRQITPERARDISLGLPSHIQTVGVFVNEERETVEEIAKIVELDFIQLHGDESPEYCESFSIPVIKAFSIKQKSDIEQLKKYNCAYYLVDSPGVQYRGGSGMPFDWGLLTDEQIPRDQLILAGGLRAENIKEAIAQVQPIAVDVSSGVETNKQKDPKKIEEFIRKAKATV